MTSYNYSLSIDFVNGVNLIRLSQEINDGITSSPELLLIIVDTDLDNVEISFDVALSMSQETELDNVIANHLGVADAELFTNGFINIESTLADNRAIIINASNSSGGIEINAGMGGIVADTTNGISFDAGAESNFTTSNGNLILNATAGLVNVDSGSGINMGNNTAAPILIGSTAFNKNITLGNSTGSTNVDIFAGTGGINLDSNNGSIILNANNSSSNFTLNTNADSQDLMIALQGNTDSSLILQSSGTGSDALGIYTTQGNIQMTALGTTNNISLATAFAGSGNISISSSVGGSGNVILESGSGNVVLQSVSGDISLATTFGGSGNVSVSSAVGGSGNITLEAGSSGISINSYNGGAIGIGHFNGGDLFLGSASAARTIAFGNNTGNTRIFQRWGTGGLVEHQDNHISLSDADATLAVPELLSQILVIAPTTNRTLTLPTAADIVSNIAGIQVNDCINFKIIHTTTSVSDPFVTLAMGTGGTSVGFMEIHPRINNLATYISSGSADFKLRMTNVTSSTESYVVYR